MKQLLKAMIVAVCVAGSTIDGGAQVASTAPVGSAQNRAVVSSVTEMRPDIERAAKEDNQAADQPLMATGIDLGGKPRRFPAHQAPGHSSMVAY